MLWVRDRKWGGGVGAGSQKWVGSGGVRGPEPIQRSCAHRANAVSQAGRRSLGFRFPEESVHLGRPRRISKHWSKTRNGSRITSASAVTSGSPCASAMCLLAFPHPSFEFSDRTSGEGELQEVGDRGRIESQQGARSR